MFLVIPLLLLLSCGKNALPIPPLPIPMNPCGDTSKELKVFWQIPLLKDTGQFVGSTLLAFGDKIGIIIDDKITQRLITYHAGNGTLLWQHTISPDIFGDKDMAWGLWQNKVVLKCSNKQHIVNQQDGQLVAKALIPRSGASRISVFSNRSYMDGGTDQFVDSTAYMLQLHLATLKWDTICTLKRRDHFGFMGFLEPPAFGTNSMNDSIIYFKFRGGMGLFVYAYNMTQKRVEWRKDSLDYDGSVYPPIVENDRVYVDGLGTIYCLDANTGQPIWSRYVGSRLVGGTRLFLYQDRIATISLGGKFIVLDKKTGEWIYNYQDNSSGDYDLNTPSAAVVHNGVMYVMAGGSFYGLDLETGTILGKYRSPNRCKKGALFGYGGIAANAVSNCIYIDDEYFLMAIKAFK
jgi:outer membrane protein assembly factor BamB